MTSGYSFGMKRPGALPCILLATGLVAVALSLTLPFWRPLLHPLVFNAEGNYHTDAPMSLVSGIVSAVEGIIEWGGLWGTILALAAMPGSCALLPAPWRSWRYTLTLTGAGLLFTGISIITSMEFFLISPGTAIRPMMWSAEQGLLLLTGVLLVLCLGPWSVKSDAPRWLQWLGIILCLAPTPVGCFMLHCAMHRNNLMMSE